MTSKSGYGDGQQGLLDNIPAGIVIVDKHMKVAGFNNAWSEICRECIGKEMERGADISASMDEGVAKMLAQAIHGKKVEASCHQLEKAKDRYFDLIAVPVMGGGAMLMAVESTKRCQEMKALEAAKSEAEFYVDLMSHDIRNFNQVTMGYIELLQLSGALSDVEKAYLEKAQKGVIDSNKLIDNIKKVRLIRQFAGKKLIRMDLCRILVEDSKEVGNASPKARISLDFEAKEPRYIMADEYVHEIFRHIMENAVKYDPHPEKLIDVTLKPVKRDGGDYWSVAIADHGPGIPDEKKSAIFERMSRTTRGAGVGLSIVSVIVSKYGGRIYVEDRVKGDPSQGSVFTVELPRGSE
ncbi:sensor histidine kinase [Methanocella conradii]|uniref:sensor histidine kinase n=1 Tax=Methanocella conradii TaxID=1175444 RepID=UPI00157E1C32|nr:HAMP domain-containing sensor histidine kinase [Methanocella conradii]